MKSKKYHTVRTVIKYHTVGTFIKYHTVGTVTKYHTVGTVTKYHTVGAVLKYHTFTLNIFYCSKRQKDKTQVKQLRQSSPITYITKYTIEHNNI